MPPQQFAGFGLERCDKSADPFVGPGYSRDQLIFDDERCQRAAVVLNFLRHCRLPYQISCSTIECDDMSIVGNKENLIVENCHSAIGPQSCVAHHLRTLRTRVLPNLTAG